MSWEFIVLFIFFIMMIGTLAAVSIIGDLANIAKWLGLGAIAGNVINNKINATAATRQGRRWNKTNRKTKNKYIDSAVEFISPTLNDVSSDLDNQEYQEFLKWKESQK
ncbi:ribonuclease [Streptococcus dentiloxodontae]